MSSVPNETMEAERLRALASYGILDTDFEETYDRLTRLAADLFGTSIAAILLIDLTRQWFKSRTGIDTRETPRDIAFCDHAIRETGVFVVPDAPTDRRFSGNPLVVSDPFIRFYAGAPLRSPEGFALGTICVYDPTPRDAFSKTEQQRLEDFSGIVMDLMNARRRAIDAGNDLARLKTSIDRILGKMSI